MSSLAGLDNLNIFTHMLRYVRMVQGPKIREKLVPYAKSVEYGLSKMAFSSPAQLFPPSP